MDDVARCPYCGQALAAAAAVCPVCGWVRASGTARDGRLLRNGELRLLRRLGDGGSASLYLADTVRDGELRVVKEFHPPLEWKARSLFEAMFREEAQLLSRLSKEHPAIPHFYDSFIDSGAFYIILEFVPGQNLDTYMNAQVGHLPRGEALAIIRQVAEVLVAIHGLHPHPIIHGDIKPSNLIRRPDGQITVIDFGLAHATGSMPPYLPGHSSAFGTPGYTPPEQWEGHPVPASDIFALGATMHHLLTGRSPAAPFAHRNQLSVADLTALTTFRPLATLLPGTPPALDRLVAQMLQRRPAERPTAPELQARLARLDPISLP